METAHNKWREVMQQCVLWAFIMAALILIPYLVLCLIKPLTFGNWIFKEAPGLLINSVPTPFIGIIHYYWLYSSYLKKKKYAHYIILLLPFIALIQVINLFYGVPLYYLMAYHAHSALSNINIWRLCYYLANHSFLILFVVDVPFIIFYTAMRGIGELSRRRKELEFEQKKTAVLLLKSQLEPHFLFNTLNAIYATAQKEQAKKTLGVIEELSGMARYIMQEGEKELVTVETKLKFIDQYLELQRLGTNDKTVESIKTNLSWDRKPTMIQPMALLPMIEYIFNTASPEDHSTATIDIAIESQKINLTATWKSERFEANNHKQTNGLSEIKKLLENTYKNNYYIEEKSEHEKRSVSLTINLDTVSIPTTLPIADMVPRKKHEVFHQFFRIWLILYIPIICETLMNFFSGKISRKEFEPAREFIYSPALLAVMSLTIVGHYYLLYKKYIHSKKYMAYIPRFIGYCALLILLDFGVDEFFLWTGMLGHYESTLLSNFLISVQRILFAAIPIAFVYAMVRDFLKARRAKNKLEQQNRINELLLMKNKMKPDFITNILNTLHATAVQEQAVKTAAYLKELKELFRYSAEDADKETVKVSDEIDFINRYLHLQRIRITDSELITIAVKIGWDGKPANIAPMLLLPFIENAFKYGISYEQPSKIDININIAAERLECHILNTDYANGINAHSGGRGLINTTKRLNMQYNKRYELHYGSNNGTYAVSLKLDLS